MASSTLFFFTRRAHGLGAIVIDDDGNVIEPGTTPTAYSEGRAIYKLPNWQTPPPVTQANTYYVNGSTGNDSTGDGTSATPYKTLYKAGVEWGNDGNPTDTAFLLQDDLMEYLHDGTSVSIDSIDSGTAYNSTPFTTNGTSAAPIVIRTDPAWRDTNGRLARIRGTGISRSYTKNGGSPRTSFADPVMLSVQGDHYHVFDLELTDCAGTALYIGGNDGGYIPADDFVGYNLHVHHTGGDAIFAAEESQSPYLYDCLVHHAQDAVNDGDSASGIKLVKTTGARLERVLIGKVTDDGLDLLRSSSATIVDCHAWLSGYYYLPETWDSYTLFDRTDETTASTGNGSGFKCGNSTSTNNRFRRCSSVYNKAYGFNHNGLQDGEVYNCTALDNGNTGFIYRDGTALIHNIAHGNNSGGNQAFLDNTNGDWCPNQYNTWGDGTSTSNPKSVNNYDLSMSDGDFTSVTLGASGGLVPLLAGTLGLTAPSTVSISGHNFPELRPHLGAFAPE